MTPNAEPSRPGSEEAIDLAREVGGKCHDRVEALNLEV